MASIKGTVTDTVEKKNLSNSVVTLLKKSDSPHLYGKQLKFCYVEWLKVSSGIYTEGGKCIGMTNTKLGLSSRLRRDEASIRRFSLGEYS